MTTHPGHSQDVTMTTLHYLADNETPLASHDRERAARFVNDALDAFPDFELANALATLPVQFRLAVDYRDVVGLRCREIAEVMACCEGTVVSRLHRGRRRLRTLLRTSREQA
jgi:RNA polymerase sigma-70 factor (ECF subfamily)